MNDIVHIDKYTIMSFPCLPMQDDENQEPETANENQDHLQEHGTPLCGLGGLNDIVHIDKETIVSIPCLPLEGN
jgi:hypothetical protein